MINFRYHVVSLVAVFLALAVGIAAGVAIGPALDRGLLQQAEEDRRQVSELRAELDRRNRLDDYRGEFATQVGTELTAGVLTGVRVAVVALPDAPGNVLQAVEAAAEEAGGTVVRQVRVNPEAFDPAASGEVNQALQPYAGRLNLTDSATQAQQVGAALGRAVLAPQPGTRDDSAVEVAEALTDAGLANLGDDDPETAQLALVVGAEATDPPVAAELVLGHVQLVVALHERAGVVLAGPNSAGVEGSDVLTARTEAQAADTISTVDVADLPSGVVTTVLAGKAELLGRQGHYGALDRAEAPLPALPLR